MYAHFDSSVTCPDLRSARFCGFRGPHVPQHGVQNRLLYLTLALCTSTWASCTSHEANLGNFGRILGRCWSQVGLILLQFSPTCWTAFQRRENSKNRTLASARITFSGFRHFAKAAKNALKTASQAKLAPRALGSASGPRFWANLKPTCGQLGANLGQLAANLGLHRPTWGQLAANFGLLGVNLGQLGAILP